MKRSLLCILLAPLLFFSCQDDVVEEIESLNSTGEQFIELISTYGDWRTDWDKINEMGTPLPNEAGIIYVIPQNGYYILPVLNDNEITSVVLYPIRVVDKKRLTTTSPVIVGKEEAKENDIVQNFLESKLFNEWREKGYSINIEKNDTLSVEHASLSRHVGLVPYAHLFCFQVDGYIYTLDPTQYVIAENEIFKHTDGLYYKLRYQGADLVNDGGHFCVIFPADRFTFEEARRIFRESANEYSNLLRNVPYVVSLYFSIINEYSWSEYTGGGGGGQDSEGTPDVNIQNGDDIIKLINDSVKTTLTPLQLQKLKNAFDELLQHPELKAMVNALNKVGFKLSFHIGPVVNDGYAQFNKKDQTVTFLSENNITSQHLCEEFLHAVQYTVYGDAIGDIKRNVEYEVKVMQDLLAYKNGTAYGFLGAFSVDDYKGDPTYYVNYQDFIIDTIDGVPFDKDVFQRLFNRWQGYPGEPQIDYFDPIFIQTFFKNSTNN